MELPKNWKFTKDHEWLSIGKDGVADVGVTHFAIEQLGDIVHIDLPEVGATFGNGDPFGTIESTKTVSDLYMPVSGKVVDVNRDLAGKPESLRADSAADGWLVRVELDDGADQSHLMSSSDYQHYIAEQENH